jgi:hypothetical protein
MTADRIPEISVGLPVFNGERYLDEAIQSILAQTITDLEVVICDNASTDRTEAICRSYAASDDRVRYVRNPSNIGANCNYNRVARLARGRYFKWMAADDRCLPNFLARARAVLEADPTVVAAIPEFCDIDEHGQMIGGYPYDLDLGSPAVVERFGHLMCTSQGQRLLYGLIRRPVLMRTGLLANFYGSDRPLLSELVLHGRVIVIPGVGWESREHPGRSSHVRRSTAWKGERTPSDGLVHLKIAVVVLRGIGRAPIGWRQRLACGGRLVRCIGRRRGRFASALAVEARGSIPDVRSAWRGRGRGSGR